MLFALAHPAMSAVLVRSPDAIDTIETTEFARDPEFSNGTHVERRQAAQVARVAKVVIDGVTDIIKGIQNGIKQDKLARSGFTQQLVAQMHQKHPDYNWIICHTKHTTKFDGKRGTDWDHRHQEFDVKIGGTVGYEIYNLKSGEFTRQGDGGFLNWAYIGNIKKNDQGGKHLVFAKP
ncbi:hypothetical protein HGRIS_008927 [Hohenbuehelia grisea]|uniref:DUF7888 domain-containing protein n=1 Tax=Hohenbuehelia grisea TaxID=104357 RepID=A0ABR3IZZ6_9AGAR